LAQAVLSQTYRFCFKIKITNPTQLILTMQYLILLCSLSFAADSLRIHNIQKETKTTGATITKPPDMVITVVPGYIETFTFVADDGVTRTAHINVTDYDASTHTYTFGKCLDENMKPDVCFHAGCIGKCGSGCGRDVLTPECKRKETIKHHEYGQGPQCKTRCFNHDVCAYVERCAGSVDLVDVTSHISPKDYLPSKMLSTKWGRKKTWGCKLLTLHASTQFNPSPIGECPENYKGFTSLQHAMTSLRQTDAGSLFKEEGQANGQSTI